MHDPPTQRYQVQSIKKSRSWAGALSLSVAMLALIFVAPLPLDLRAVLLLGLFLGWTTAGGLWLIRRFGTIAAVGLVIVAMSISGVAAYAYLQDEPNRRAVAEIHKLRGSSVRTNGKMLTGQIEYVRFDWQARDEDLRHFVEMEGLETLETLVLEQTRINNETVKRLDRLAQLKRLHLEVSGIDKETVAHLHRALPDCHVDVVWRD